MVEDANRRSKDMRGFTSDEIYMCLSVCETKEEHKARGAECYSSRDTDDRMTRFRRDALWSM